MLDALQLQPVYRSNRHQLLCDFYLPCLERASSYDRSVGYFSSTSLALAAAGFNKLIERHGQVRLVASPSLTEEDAKAIREGYDLRERVSEALVRQLAPALVPDRAKDRLGFLAWMIAEGRLDIKIALVDTREGIGIYHEKVGIFRDDSGNAVVFKGSANEGFGGLVANFETLDVFCSWKPEDKARVSEAIDDFEALWANETRHLRVLDFPEAAKRSLLTYRPPTQPMVDPEEIQLFTAVAQTPHRPPTVQLRQYQKDAIERWWAANGRGIWEMATGTGKTLTALSALVSLSDLLERQKKTLVCVVVVPFKHLVDQWGDQADDFGFRPIRCYEAAADWAADLADALAGLRGKETGLVTALVTNATFASEHFQGVLRSIRSPLLLIGDEVHNLGAPWLRTQLPPDASYRLGLSATPTRHRDEAGTAAIIDYFGQVVFEYGIARAIEEGHLTPYAYHPIEVALAPDELDEYLELTRQIARHVGAGFGELAADDEPEGPLKILLIKRARLLGVTRSKLSTLHSLMSGLSQSAHNLIYCSDASGPVETGGQPVRQIEAAVRMLGHDLGMQVNSYTHETPTAERLRLRNRLAAGEIQALVAIRCLDEGIDIPEVRRGFILASSTNPRQFIQRRGRMLRLAKNKQQAEIFDFIVSPPREYLDAELFQTERSLVRRELERVVEFARTAVNGPQALAALRDLRHRYHLLDVG
jgi:DNA phosphorothioation system restriction enzyme